MNKDCVNKDYHNRGYPVLIFVLEKKTFFDRVKLGAGRKTAAKEIRVLKISILSINSYKVGDIQSKFSYFRKKKISDRLKLWAGVVSLFLLRLRSPLGV